MSLLRGLASAVACAATPGSRFVSLDATKPLDLDGGKAGTSKAASRSTSKPGSDGAGDGADDDVMVFLLAGQSNMVGRGNGSALSKKLLRRLHSLSDPTKEDSPIGYYAAGLAGASSTSYNDSVCSMGIEHRQKVFDLRSSAFQPIERMRLGPVDGCAWEKAIFRLDTHFGPEISLGLALNEQWPTRRIVLSKRALSGSTLATGWTPGTDGYRALLADFRLIAADNYPRRVVLSGFLWLQGEADAKDAADASNYERNLLRLVTSLRHDTGALELPIVFVGLPGGLPREDGEPAPPRPYQEEVDNAFEHVANSLERVSYLANAPASASDGPSHHLAIGSEGGVARLSDADFEDTVRRFSKMRKLDPGLTDEARAALRNQVCYHYSSAAHLRIGARAAGTLAWRHNRPPAPWPTWDSEGAPAENATIYDYLEQREAHLLPHLPTEDQMGGGTSCLGVR